MAGWLFKNLRFNEYVRNFTALAGSEIIAQVILVGVTPLLTRIYTPFIFGQYEFFKSSALLLVVIGFLNYDACIYTSKSGKERISSIVLSAIILTVICLIASVALFLFNDDFVRVSGSEIEEGWFWSLPLYAFFTALTNLMLVVLTKSGSFKLLSRIKIVVSLLVASTQLLFGWLSLGYWGLVYSTIVVQFIAFVLYARPFFREVRSQGHELTKESIVSVLSVHWRLPALVLPGNFLNNVVQVIPVFFLGKMDSQLLGYYGLAKRIIDFPLTFVTSAVQKLYVKELTDEIQMYGTAKRIYLKNLKIFGFVAVVLYIGIFLLTRPIVPLLFGDEWLPAVPFILILGFLFSVRFVFGGLSFIMILGRAPKFALLWQAFFGLAMTGIFVFCIEYGISSINTIFLYSLLGSACYVLYGILSYSVAKSKNLLNVR
jgi:O-antigen/teichoic acid export membrane protein